MNNKHDTVGYIKMASCSTIVESKGKKNILNLSALVDEMRNSPVEFCETKGLVSTVAVCTVHDQEMKLGNMKASHGFGNWRCFSRTKKADHIFSRLKGTWFENTKITPQKALIISYCFASKFSYAQTIQESSFGAVQTSSGTVADWFSYCREICLCALDEEYEEKGEIGGVGHIVEIDESKIGKRKYNRGRMVEGSWILGMIDCTTGDFRLEICPDNKRDKQTLNTLIRKHVLPGTEIHTDEWKGYVDLEKLGYIHKTVNHSVNFVNPKDGTNTQKIESNWRPLKARLARGGVKPDHMADHLAEYLWRKRCQNSNLAPFEELLKDICKINPPPTSF